MAKRTAAIRLSATLVLIALGGVGLAGCAADSGSSIEARSGTAKPNSDDAASFADDYLKKSAERPVEQKQLPLTLTKEQSAQLMTEGKVDGISEGDLRKHIDAVYANSPIGKFVYFPEDAPLQDRLQTIILLSMGSTLNSSTLGSGGTIDPGRITVEGSGSDSRATIPDSNLPPLIFVEGNWWIDGPAVLASMKAS